MRKVLALALFVSAVPLLAQQPPAPPAGAQGGRAGGPPGPPLTPQAAAPIDLTGYWVAVITEDWRWRMVTPPKGDYASIPITQAAKDVAGSGDQGVAVVGVDPNGPAAERGIKTGDVILDVAGKAVANTAEVRKALSDARAAGKNTVLLRVKTAEAMRFVALPIKKA